MFLLVLLFIFLILLYIETSKEASKIYKSLDEFQLIARGLNTSNELSLLEVIVKIYKKKYCWHVRHIECADEVLTYIKNRREELEKGL